MEYPSLDKPTAGAFRFNTDSSNLEIYDGNQWTGVQSGLTPELQTGGTRALYCLGNEGPGSGTNRSNRIEYINISTTGNGVDFGDATERLRAGPFALSSRTRALMGGGQNPGFSDTINYVTITQPANAADFGNLVSTGRQFVGGSNQTRGLIWGYGAPSCNVMQYMTIASTGNAVDFGDIASGSAASGAAYGDKTRSVYAGGYASTVVQYANIATTGNSSNFGDMLNPNKVYVTAGAGNAVRGLMFGGNQMAPAAGTKIDTIAYNTYSTLGDQIDFGNLDVARWSTAAASTATRAVCMGGYSPANRDNKMQYVNIATTGDPTDFGDLTTERSDGSGCSNGHGGL